MRRTSSSFRFLGLFLDTIGSSFSVVRHVFSDLFSTIFFFGGNFVFQYEYYYYGHRFKENYRAINWRRLLIGIMNGKIIDWRNRESALIKHSIWTCIVVDISLTAISFSARILALFDDHYLATKQALLNTRSGTVIHIDTESETIRFQKTRKRPYMYTLCT